MATISLVTKQLSFLFQTDKEEVEEALYKKVTDNGHNSAYVVPHIQGCIYNWCYYSYLADTH
jgi:hypothetical protein